MVAESESQDFTQRSLDIAETVIDSDVSTSFDLFLPLVILTVILGGLTVYHLWKLKKSESV